MNERMTAAYDDIADWYETSFLNPRSDDDPIGIRAALGELLPAGSGVCLELGCGTGVYAAPVRQRGWTPIGVDLSSGMLGHARGRLPIAQADAARMPIADRSVDAVLSMMAHTDMPDYSTVLSEVRRVLRTGGIFVHIGVHPCFCGGFADWTDRAAVVIRPGYRDTYFTRESWTSEGIRDKVGAVHRPLPELLTMVIEAGLRFERFAEGPGEPIPTVFGFRAVASG